MVKAISVITLVLVPLTIGLVMSRIIDAVISLFKRDGRR